MRIFALFATMIPTTILGVASVCTAWAGPSPVVATSASATVSSPSPATMNFPLTRSGDGGYATWIRYATQDGTAKAGTDYTAASGVVEVPAGATGANIPVQILGASLPSPGKQFTLKLLGAVGVGPTPAFATQQTFATGNGPTSVTAADVNGDGKPDLIEVNRGDNTVSVYLNTTAPGAASSSFAAPQTFAVGSKPAWVTTADVNGDGKPDLIVANSGSDTVSVLLNTTAPGATTPSFAAQDVFAVGSIPTRVTTADVNGDGKPDLIVTNLKSDTVSVLRNTTAPGAMTPSFAAQQTFATGDDPESVTTADVNGDGKPDLIVVNFLGDTVSVLLNTTAPGASAPSFAAQESFATGVAPSSVTAVDVNGDGKPDLIVANGFSDTVSVFLNTTAPGATTPSFTAQQTFPTGRGFFPAVTAVDVNGDGKPDLIVADEYDNTVSVLLNTTVPGAASASFAAPLGFAVGSDPESVTTADVNGDGKPDLIVADEAGNMVSVLLNTSAAPTASAPSFATQQSFATGAVPTSVTTADVNGDGKPDLIVANSASDTVSVLLNTTAPGASTSSFATQLNFATGGNPGSVTTADVNGDGKPDLIVANTYMTLYGNVSVLLNTTPPGAATPSFAAPQTYNFSYPANSVSVADVNGDGKPDLIVAGDSSSVSVLLNTTAPGATTPSFAAPQTFASGYFPTSVTMADVNGDGKPDLIVANQNSGTVSVLLNTTAPGATTASFAAPQAFAVGNFPISVAVADVNGDGRPDLIVANAQSDTVSVLLNTTAPGAMTPSFAAQQTFATGRGTSSVTTADVNGDGKPDLIVANTLSNSVLVLLNTTAPGAMTPSFAAPQAYTTGTQPFSVATADVNGDGEPDLLTASYNGSTVSVLLNTQYAASVKPASVTGTIHYAFPVVVLSPGGLDFGSQRVGGTGVTQSVTLANTGSADLDFTLAITGAAAGDYNQSNSCPHPLAAGSNCSIKVTFQPSAAGTRIAALAITSNAPTSPDSVALSGVGKRASSGGGGAWGLTGLGLLAAFAGLIGFLKRRRRLTSRYPISREC